MNQLQYMEEWPARNWIALGFLLLLFLIILSDLGMRLASLWLTANTGPQSAPRISELSFVEFQQVQTDEVVKTQDLSDQIIEKDALTEESKVNWNNAADPAFDFDQRYDASLEVNVSRNDYPAAARRSSIGTVTARVELYIDKNGRIRDLKVKEIRSPGNAHKPFEQDFIAALRRLYLQKARLRSAPYQNNGQPVDFRWTTVISFTLD